MAQEAQINIGPQGVLPDGIYFDGLWGQPVQKYPAWRYHKVHPPMIVENEAEDDEAKKAGFDAQWAPITANHCLVNWHWDLEDMSTKQLSVYAWEEYGVDLPVEAGQERLLKAIFDLAKFAPQNRGRLVLMAHTIRMNYEQTLLEVQRMAEGGFSETITEEFEA